MAAAVLEVAEGSASVTLAMACVCVWVRVRVGECGCVYAGACVYGEAGARSDRCVVEGGDVMRCSVGLPQPFGSRRYGHVISHFNKEVARCVTSRRQMCITFPFHVLVQLYLSTE